MILQNLLDPGAIRVLPSIGSKKRLFHAVADVAATVYGLPSETTADAILEREKLGPTGVGHGVALPHARIEGLPRVCGVFVRLDRPVEYGAIDRQPVDLVFALLAPVNAGVDHLKALASVSRTLRNGDLCAKLRANDELVALHAILTERNTSHAA